MSDTPDERSRLAIVRHGSAGSRSKWETSDRLRPLTPKGQRQANAIATRYEIGAMRIVSSPYVRCMQTVAPLAKITSIDLEEIDLLGEGTDPLEAFHWLVEEAGSLDDGDVLVACTHGDLLFGFVELLNASDFDISHDPATIQKGSTIEIDLDAGTVVDAHYLPPVERDSTSEH